MLSEKFLIKTITLCVGLAVGCNVQSSVIYSEDFSNNPNYSSTSPSNVYWDSSQEIYHTKVQDNGTPYYGYSPSFTTVSSGSNFSLSFDMNPVTTGWGTYPEFNLKKTGITTDRYDREVRVESHWDDHNYNKFPLFVDGGHSRSPTFSTNTWYTQEISYDADAQVMGWKVTERDTGSVFHQDSLSGVTVGDFDQISLGHLGAAPHYGNNRWAETDFDNITLTDTINSDVWKIAHYEFEGDATDSSGNNNHGTAFGGVDFNADGVIGNTASFDGVNDYIDVPDNLISSTGDLTVSAWINTSETGDIFSNNNGGEGRFGIGINGDDELTAFVGKGGTGSPDNFVLSDNQPITDNEWRHITATREGLEWNLFVDGENVATDTTTNFIDTSKPLVIGARGNLIESTFFSGEIDDLRIYNHALDADEIQTLSGFIPKEENNYKTIIRDELDQPIYGHLEYWEDSRTDGVYEYAPDSFFDVSSGTISDATIFNPDAPTYVLVHGWRPQDLNGYDDEGKSKEGGVPQDENHIIRTQIRSMAEKLYDRHGDNINILAYNYEYEAGSAYTHAEMAALCLTTIGQSTGYCEESMTDFVPNHQVDRQALKLSESLSKYLDLVDPSGNGFTGDLNFVGHSLGAGIVGHAVALDSEDSISNKYGDQIKKITLLDPPDDWTSNILGGDVNLQGAIDKINNNHNINPIIENYIASKGLNVKSFGVDYSGAINTYLKNEDHTSAGWTWYPITMQSSARINTSPGLTDADELYSKRSGFNQNWNSTSYDKTFETTDLSSWEVVEKTSFFESLSLFSTDDTGNLNVDYGWFNDNSTLIVNDKDLVFSVDGNSGRKYNDSYGFEVYTGISASPILFNTDLLLDLSTDWLSFEFNVSDVDYDDILVLAINGDILYERRGNSINLGLWDFSGLIDISSYHNQFINLTLGLYTDDTGKSFSFRNLKFYESKASVPNPSTIALMILGLIGFSFKKSLS